MKRKTIFSAFLTIALCLSLVVGSSFALLTTEKEFNIAVASANVSMTAGVSNIKLYSAVAAEPGAQNTMKDQFQNEYVYQQQADNFISGGTATFSGAKLDLSLITPGDKVEFTVGGTNTGDIALKSRLLISYEESSKLIEGLVFTVNGGQPFTLSTAYTTEWKTVAMGEDMQNIVVTVELPVSAGNDYKDLVASIFITVEAVQVNGTR